MLRLKLAAHAFLASFFASLVAFCQKRQAAAEKRLRRAKRLARAKAKAKAELAQLETQEAARRAQEASMVEAMVLRQKLSALLRKHFCSHAALKIQNGYFSPRKVYEGLADLRLPRLSDRLFHRITNVYRDIPEYSGTMTADFTQVWFFQAPHGRVMWIGTTDFSSFKVGFVDLLGQGEQVLSRPSAGTAIMDTSCLF